MSYSFYLDTGLAPDFWNLINSVSLDGETDQLRFANLNLPESGPFQEDIYYQLYLDNISTRFIEMRYSGGTFQIRTMIASCPADYRVAIELVRLLATQFNVLIQIEGGDAMDLDAFNDKFSAGWIVEHVENDIAALRSMLRDPNMRLPLMIDGPNRPLFLGPIVLAEIDDDDLSLFANKLIAKLQFVHYFDAEREYSSAEHLYSGDRSYTFSTWLADTAYIFEPVDYLLVSTEQICVPYFSLVDVAKHYVETVLDDGQVVTKKIPLLDWPTFVEHAKTFSVELPSPLELPPPKKWWQFWKTT